MRAVAGAPDGSPRFTTLLVANRGEIAVRIIGTARSLGLSTVAVYSDADAGADHVRAADTAVRIGPSPAAASYLDVEAVLGAARDRGAQAVHPGYGFLAESAAFARACAAAGLVFVGPPADVIAMMAGKDVARRIAADAGVPVLPAVEAVTPSGEPLADDAVLARAADLGYPVLVKPVAGGGGKGMHVVPGPADLLSALGAARREARAAFGDERVLLEAYLRGGRHVEVQVLGDEHGSVIHLHERDCSVQRRYQKVVEEAPAPTLPAGLRERLLTSSVALARRVGYVGAGTVEFVVAGGRASFLEMNTRLQVEHPVTEMLTGLDLVALQLQVAQGAPLPITQEGVRLAGHAIEARVYAESPEHGFLPQAGRVRSVRWPPTRPVGASGVGVRVDTGLTGPGEITSDYDPMIAKIVVAAPTREQARVAMLGALDATAVTGVPTNVGFLRALVAGPQFAAAAVDTGWLDARPPVAPRPPDLQVLVAAAFAVLRRSRQGSSGAAFGRLDGWRLGGPPAPARVDLRAGDRRHVVLVGAERDAAGTHLVMVDGEPHRAWLRPVAGGPDLLDLDGRTGRLFTEAPRAPGPGEPGDALAVSVVRHGQVYDLAVPTGRRRGGALAPAGGVVVSPMPATLTVVSAAVGDRVAAGAVLGVLEAMKMEHPLLSPLAGQVVAAGHAAGSRVRQGEVLFVVQPDDGWGANDG